MARTEKHFCPGKMGLIWRIITTINTNNMIMKHVELIQSISRDINKIADGIGAKYGRMISSVVSFIVGYTIGFIYVWQLTLVMLSLFPLMVIVGAMMSKVHMTMLAYQKPRIYRFIA
jgi:ABC-type multidrug transport system fused ATPase/permease subunit